MTAQQANATAFNPNQLNLTQVASYQRRIKAPIARVWENVLDWEHLPWLHKTSFDHIEVDVAGDWGWRTWSNPERTNHVELCVADEANYVARSYQAGQQVSEIWTCLTPADSATDIKVEFHIPDVAPEAVGKLGDLMTGLYTQLWDEDEAMMMERETRLSESREVNREISLGQEADLREQLRNSELIRFQLGRREYVLRMIDNEFTAHSSICPHLLGPLTDAICSDRTVVCPWHGYRFNIDSGECLSPKSANCHLPKAPLLSIADGELLAKLT